MKWISFSFTLFFLPIVANASSQTFVNDGYQINLVPPPGYCLLNGDTKQDADFLNNLRINSATDGILGGIMNCDLLHALRDAMKAGHAPENGLSPSLAKSYMDAYFLAKHDIAIADNPDERLELLQALAGLPREQKLDYIEREMSPFKEHADELMSEVVRDNIAVYVTIPMPLIEKSTQRKYSGVSIMAYFVKGPFAYSISRVYFTPMAEGEDGRKLAYIKARAEAEVIVKYILDRNAELVY